MTTKAIHNDFFSAKELLYDKCGFELTEPVPENEGSEYGACYFKLNGNEIKFRVSKITPAKTGQFVTIWKRNAQGLTEPFNESDELVFVIISSRSNENLGQFIFPKAILVEKGIISGKNKTGKRGIRVYPPWDKPGNKQAVKTQAWQINYFLHISDNNTVKFDAAKKLLTKTILERESYLT